jgi:glycosyltransferase involved in cell wall biosynthesis
MSIVSVTNSDSARLVATDSAQTSPTETLVSIVIPHLNQPDSLDVCLSTLDEQTFPRSQFEVIVVDNGSTFSPEAIIARYPGTRLLREPQPGPGPARNLGARHATGKYLAFIDADCRAHPNWLSAIARSLSSAPDGTILGGDVQIWRSNNETYTPLEAYECVFAYRFKLYIEKHGYCGTGNMAMRRSDFARVGPFAGIQIAEDVEWGARARAAGLTLRYVPEMVVFHPARGSLQELCAKWQRHIHHLLNAARKKPGWRAHWIARAVAVLCSPVVDAAKVLSSDRLSGLSARLKALYVLVIVRAYRAWKMIDLLGRSGEVVWNRDAKLTALSGNLLVNK